MSLFSGSNEIYTGSHRKGALSKKYIKFTASVKMLKDKNYVINIQGDPGPVQRTLHLRDGAHI